MTGGPAGTSDYLGITGTGGTCNGSGQYRLYVDHAYTPCYIGNNTLSPSTWSHVAVTFDGGTIQFYINGVASQAITGAMYDYGIATYTIGGNTVGGSTTKPSFNGLIDEVQVYSRSLSAAEIRALMLGNTRPLSPSSVSPASGAASNQPMTFTFTDPLGFADLGVLNILINNSLDGRRSCYLAYSQPDNVMYLVSDDGGSLLPGASLSAQGSISNSQCTLNWTASAVSKNGNTLALSLSITYPASFGGNRIIYMAARDVNQNNSGWMPMGVTQIPGAPQTTTTAVAGMSPQIGTGLGPAPYTFTFSDTQGVQDLGVQNLLVNNSLDGRQACYLAFVQPINVLYLVNDTGDGLLPGQSTSAAGTLSNSQCAVTWASNAVTTSGNNLTLSLSMSFTESMGNSVIFYLASRDGTDANNTGWQAMGTRALQ